MKSKMKSFLIVTFLLVSFFIIGFLSVEKYGNWTYETVDTPINQGFKALNQAKKDHQSIIVLLRMTGCKDCERDEKTLVKSVDWGRTLGNHIIVMDLKQMNLKQKQQLKRDFPKILYQNQYFSTPTVFKAQYQGRWEVTQVENQGNVKRMNQILMEWR